MTAGEAGATPVDGPAPGAELVRLIEVMHRLRSECPWDAQQTHRSLVPYLVEETFEVVEAIETATLDGGQGDIELREELGDLVMQVYFHAEIASERGAFDLDDVAAGIADKLIRRHPHVFGDDEAPDDLRDLWERRKAVEKQRSSALDGIPDMSALSRASKVIGRARSHRVAVELDADPIEVVDLGQQLLGLVARAQASGLDAEQAARDALRELERQVQVAEATSTTTAQ